ncbi:RHS repeat-associated core domain-containing protein [Corynebacterium auriscanis]|uniref:RHS repeat-associated core domain-containing protein n=1 Tax=Corynebacterium auriscanis TaxID=99807 RepID=UPI003CEE0318
MARSVLGDGAAGGGIRGGQTSGGGVSVVGSRGVVGGVDGPSAVVGREEYGLSPAGVLVSTDDGVVEFHRRLPTRVGRTSFVYDAAGRVVQTVTKRLGKKPLVHRFYYATGQQPVGFCSSDAPGVGYRYVYDGVGRRVAKEVVDTATGQVVCRQVCAHTGNQLAAVVTTVDTGDAGRVGCGLVWSVDPATGEVIGQITVAAGDGAGVKTPAAGAAGSGAAHSANRCGDGVTGDGGYLEAQCGRGPAGSGSQVVGVAGTAARAGHPEGAVASGWSQARVDARFYALVADVAGAPQEIIDPATGQVEGRVTQSLYGKRTWCGGVSSPLLFAGQYEDAESGWVYNRFRYYQPVLGSYNAQDPLGLAPRVASGQGYVDHAAHWVDVLGLASHVKNKQLQRQIDALTPQQKVFWVSPSRRIDSQVNSIGMIREPPIGVSAVKPVSLTLRLGTIQLWRRSSSKSKGSPRS